MLKYTVIAVLLIGLCMPASAQQPTAAGFIEYASIPAVSGREDALRDYIMERLPDGVHTEIDNMGSLIVIFGEGEPETLFLCQIDEPGYIISEIRDDGCMRVQPIGGTDSHLFNQFHEGRLVDICTESGLKPGVVSIPSSHISRGKSDNMTIDEFIIDVGAESAKEVRELGFSELDAVTAKKDFALLAGNLISGPLLSRKFAGFALLEAAKRYAPPAGKTVAFAWTTLGNMRNSGAARLQQVYSPEKIYLVTWLTRMRTDRAGGFNYPVSNPGSGVLANKRSGFESLTQLTQPEKPISVVFSQSGSSGLDRNFRDTPKIPLAIPVMFPESLTEVIDMDDLTQLIELLIAQS